MFLGILLDMTNLELRLPDDKLLAVPEAAYSGMEGKTVLHKEGPALPDWTAPTRLQSRMIELATVAKELHHHIRLNRGFKSDLEWWALFLPTWNGITMMSSVCRTQPMTTVTSDASGGWGCGAFSSDGQWFSVGAHGHGFGAYYRQGAATNSGCHSIVGS